MEHNGLKLSTQMKIFIYLKTSKERRISYLNILFEEHQGKVIKLLLLRGSFEEFLYEFWVRNSLWIELKSHFLSLRFSLLRNNPVIFSSLVQIIARITDDKRAVAF